MPTVSIVIPFLNAEKHLRECVASVVNQSYSDWEVILVNDGSTDNSPAIARELESSQADRIQLVEHPNGENRGASAARNLGVKHARGKYIACLDSDDMWLPHKLDTQVTILDQYSSVAWVIARVKYFNPEDPTKDFEQSFGELSEGVWEPPELLSRFVRDFSVTPCPTATLIRREVYEAVGGFEERFKMNFTDQVFFAKINARFATYVQDEVVALYRQHPNSSWNIGHRTGRYYQSQQDFWAWFYGFVQSHPAVGQNGFSSLARRELRSAARKKWKQAGKGGLQAALLARLSTAKVILQSAV